MRRTVKTALLALAGVALASPAWAQAGAEDVGGGTWHRGLIALAIGLGMGLASLGAALGQGRAAAAAMESIGRNPNAADRIQLPLILALAFMEALALYPFVIAFFLQGKV